jgi:hypothetical protein
MSGRLWGLALWAWAAATATAADDLPREVVLLAHFKQAMRQALSQVPNYTCLETIQRYGFDHHGVSFRPLDNVQLEISNVGDKELLAWPGARRFEADDISEFAAGGMMSSGLFATHARSVFLADTTIIRYHGEEEIADRPSMRYDFRVPQAWSGYRIRNLGTTAQVGTQGSFWIDPAALELIRMEVRADELPAALAIAENKTVIDYARVHIGAADARLPQSAQVLTTLTWGDAWRNDIEFSHCRAYVTESSIRFDMPETQPGGAVAAVRQVELPSGLMVTIELETAIYFATAHVGDLLRGRVAEDVRRKGKIIVPKGTLASGRIRGLVPVRKPEAGVQVMVEFEELEWEGARAEFYAEMLSASYGQPDGAMLATAGTPAARIPGTGLLHMKAQFRMAPGFKTTWRTLQPNERRRMK